jgi:hypothetical protein
MITDSALPAQFRLTSGMKKLIESISSDIIEAWPPYTDGQDPNSRNVLVLVNSYAFAREFFHPRLQLKVNEDANAKYQVVICSSCCV